MQKGAAALGLDVGVGSGQLSSGCGSLWSGGPQAASQHICTVDFLVLLSFEETQLIL